MASSQADPWLRGSPVAWDGWLESLGLLWYTIDSMYPRSNAPPMILSSAGAVPEAACRMYPIVFGLLFVLLHLCLSVSAWAQTPDHTRAQAPPRLTLPQQRASVLASERRTLETSRAQLESLIRSTQARAEELTTKPPTNEELELVRAELESAKLSYDGLAFVVETTERQIQEVEARIKDFTARRQLLENPATPVAPGANRELLLMQTRESLSSLQAERDWLGEQAAILAEHRDVTDDRVQVLTSWIGRLAQISLAGDEWRRSEGKTESIERLEAEFNQRLTDVEGFTERLRDPNLSSEERIQLDIRIRLAQAQATIGMVDARLLAFNDSLTRYTGLIDAQEAQSDEIRRALDQLETLSAELTTGEDILNRSIDLLQRRKEHLNVLDDDDGESEAQRARDLSVFAEVIQQLEGRRLQALDTLSRATTLQDALIERYDDALRTGLFERRTFPNTLDGLQALGLSVLNAPRVLMNQGLLSLQFAGRSMRSAGYDLWLRLALFVLILLIAAIWLRRIAHRAQRGFRVMRKRRDRFSDQVSLMAVSLLYRIVPVATCVAAVLASLYVTDVKEPGRGIIITVALAVLIGETVRNLAWMLLRSPQAPASSEDETLYFWITLFLWLLGITGTLSITGGLAGLPAATEDVLERLVMLVLLLSVWPAFRMRALILSLLEEAYGQRYWFAISRFVSLAAVLTLGALALIGLAGYLDIGWRIGMGLASFVLVTILWQIARGLLEDFVIWLKNLALNRTSFGLLWTQDVINPLHSVAKFGLLLAAVYAVFEIYRPEEFRVFEGRLSEVLTIPLFKLGGSSISTWHIVAGVVGLWFIVRFSAWVKSITYRWVYSRVSDLGVRNSLAVFTQYAIVVIGLLVVLNSLGLDLTTFTVFAGALGVGLGFGMQNIANNFVSGILLLVERPLRTGDWVQIGEGEGQVSRIGMRSLSVKTWDNQEIIIPNADVISNSFTNWTRSNSVLRTVLYLGVSYDANPHTVKGLIQEVVEHHSQILDDPGPAVFLHEFADSSVNFRVQYFCDTSRYSLMQLRSEVLFGIWDTLAKNGVEIPFPQRVLHVRSLPEGADRGLGGGSSPDGAPA